VRKVTHARKRNPWADRDELLHRCRVHDVITSANFYDCRLWGFSVVGGQIFRFSIDSRRRPYNTLALPCECVIWLLSGYKQPSYKHFPAVGAFSLKFSLSPSGEATDLIKNVREVQKRDVPPLSPCRVWWGSCVARRL